MPCEFTPDDLKPLIPDPASDLCDAFLKALLQYPVVNYKLWKCIMGEDGLPTPEFTKAVSGIKSGDYIFSASSLTRADALLADGLSYSTTTYADLFAAIGYTYGGSGASFNVPDFRARFPVAVGVGTPNVTGGPLIGTYTLGQKGGQKDNDAVNSAPHKHLIPWIGASKTNDNLLRENGTDTQDNQGPAIWGSVDVADVPEVTVHESREVVDEASLPRPEGPVGSDHQILPYTSPTDGTGSGTNGNLPPFLACFVYIKI